MGKQVHAYLLFTLIGGCLLASSISGGPHRRYGDGFGGNALLSYAAVRRGQHPGPTFLRKLCSSGETIRHEKDLFAWA